MIADNVTRLALLLQCEKAHQPAPVTGRPFNCSVYDSIL